MKQEEIEIIKGLRCETCLEERVFGDVPNDSPDNKYIYIDLGGATRCFCKKHMSYCKNGSPSFGAKLVSEIIK